MARKQKRGTRVYLCYPFGVKMYDSQKLFAKTLETAYQLGYTPVVASCYLVSTGYEMKDRSIAYRTLSGCEALLMCYEEDATEQMFREMYAALLQGIPIIRSIALS